MPSFLCSVLQRVVKSSVTLQLPEHQHKVLHLSRHLAVGFSRGQGAAGTGTAPPVPQGDAGRGCSCSGHRAGQCRGCWCFGCIHCTILSTLLQVLGSRASFLQAQTPSTKPLPTDTSPASTHRHREQDGDGKGQGGSAGIQTLLYATKLGEEKPSLMP